ncbi:nucleoside hydrolase [Maribellus sp. YY47]|uniref:nucleoside hydrolase n=1 Tax=Maribellus sp. YY47 TaxID=2929486 RepID=UPI00200120B2|nr:nucleoside hydrolase [Maribellus sp. YY47]MCK3685544.1 nucleoside hydrolase [Maribellus sp. YY47]
MKRNRYLILVLLLAAAWMAPAKNPVKIIFDTDMGPDFDDVGAITVLHVLADNGECEILACLASDRYPTVAPTIEVFNQYFGKPDIPIGVAAPGAPDFSAPNHWNDSIVAKFLDQPKTNDDYPAAVEVYRKALAAQPNKSVTIVTVGFTSNLDDLLKSGPDEFSPLSGKELVQKKVKQWVAMAGALPQGIEFNVIKDASASVYAFQHWPTPILLSGFEIGVQILTGKKVAETGDVSNPVAWAYAYNFESYADQKMEKRCSWDQTAVLCAIRNPENFFYVNGPGKFEVAEDGSNTWNPDADAQHFFLTHKYTYQHIADILDELMLHQPIKNNQ